MAQARRQSHDPLRKAIRKLVLGLEKRERERNDRRQYSRYSFDLKVHLCSQVDGDRYQNLCEAWVSDLSFGGLSCLTEHALEIDDVVYVSFEELLGRPSYIPVNVRYCRTLIGNIQRINCQFLFDNKPESGQHTEAA